MKTLQKSDRSFTQDYENGSHIVKKLRAEENQFKKKNYKEIKDLIDEEDDEEDISKYIRYIK